MNDKIFFNHPNVFKTKTENLIPLKQKEGLLEPSRKPMDENTGNWGSLLKYRKVLSCSFVNRTTDAASVERMGAKLG